MGTGHCEATGTHVHYWLEYKLKISIEDYLAIRIKILNYFIFATPGTQSPGNHTHGIYPTHILIDIQNDYVQSCLLQLCLKKSQKIGNNLTRE